MASFPKTVSAVASIGIALFASERARALDARSVGLGNTGVAYIDSGAAIYFNPALMDQTKTFSTTLTLAALSGVLETPITGPNTQFSSSSAPFPLFLAGANYRLTDRIVVGLAVYPTAGFGAKYEHVLNGQDVKLTAVAIEAAPTVSFSITKELAIGVGYRATYTQLDTGTPLLSTYAKQTVTGTNFLGAQIGLLYRPIESLRLGFAYRPKIGTSLSGTTELNGMSIPTSTYIAWPHEFRAGAALSLLDDRLLLAVDGTCVLYSDSTQELAIREDYASGPSTATAPLDWIDYFGAGVGVEYRVHPKVPLRVGYGIARSKTAPDAASYFFSPPGLLQSFHAGVGLRLEQWSFDLAGYYEAGATNVNNDRIANPGRYAIHGEAIAVSATLHL
jgi:long-subunit fatty acid transport protein